MNNQQITFIIPTRNNLEYLKLCYNGLKRNAPNHFIMILDDKSTDGTWEWCIEKHKEDNMFLEPIAGSSLPSLEKLNPIGHTILYNFGVSFCKTEIFSILHADMVIGQNYVYNMLKYLQPKAVVSATRVEPPLHPEEPNVKIIKDFGLYPDEFNQEEFENFIKYQQFELKSATSGIFAPWMMYKKDFMEIGGHDDLFAPYPFEDSDLFQRFILNKYDIFQSWSSLVYHFTCRGHKWTEEIGKEHDMFKFYEKKARRNFIRKWGNWIKNDIFGSPIIRHKYNIGIIVKNCSIDKLHEIEPWCSNIYLDHLSTIDLKKIYIRDEQPKTKFDLSSRIFYINEKEPDNDIIITIDLDKITSSVFLNYLLFNLSNMIDEVKEPGVFEYSNIEFKIHQIRPIEKSLIKCN